MLVWLQTFYFAFTTKNSLFSISVDSYGSEIDSKEQFSDVEWHSSHESSDEEISDEEISDDETTHTLAFKCIGAAHEKERQECLKIAPQKSKEENCKLNFDQNLPMKKT